MTHHPPPDVGQLAQCFDNRRLELFVLPTEQCNFRCTYCYEDFEIGRMAEPTIRGVEAFLGHRAPELRRLTLRWFGGEPLIAFDIVERVSRRAQSLAARHPALSYRGTMTTNGALLDGDRLARLVDLGVDRFQVSLDGPPAIHDRSRVRRGGQGTFDRIWKNLLAARDGDLDFGVLLRLHLTPANLEAMPRFVARVRDTFLGDGRFSVRFIPVADLGGPNSGDIPVLEPGFVEEVMQTLADGMPTGDAAPAPSAPAPLEICYAAKANALVVRADGRIAKCTVALADRRNDVGRITEDGALELDSAVIAPWLRGWAAGDGDALHCPMEGLPERRVPAGDALPVLS